MSDQDRIALMKRAAEIAGKSYDAFMAATSDEISTIMARKEEMTSTYVTVHDDVFSHSGYVIHRKDLSDVGEPYRSAIVAARAARS